MYGYLENTFNGASSPNMTPKAKEVLALTPIIQYILQTFVEFGEHGQVNIVCTPIIHHLLLRIAC